MYVYIYKERERERERESPFHRYITYIVVYKNRTRTRTNRLEKKTFQIHIIRIYIHSDKIQKCYHNYFE